jgi:hypothetical protein
LEFDERPPSLQSQKDKFDFFDVKEVTNCQTFIDHCQNRDGDSNDDSQNNNGIMRSLTSFFTGKTISSEASVDTNFDLKGNAKITAMCAVNSLNPKSPEAIESQDILVIGFSNGILLLYNTKKDMVQYINPSFTRNKKSIDCLKVSTFITREKDKNQRGGGGGSSGLKNQSSMIGSTFDKSNTVVVPGNKAITIKKQVILFALVEGKLSFYEIFP